MISKPYYEDYYEVVWTLSDYISQHSSKSLNKLEKIIGKDAYVLNKESCDEEYAIWDIITKPYVYYYWYRPEWIITNSEWDVEVLPNMECKDWLKQTDVMLYIESHNIKKIYYRETEKCENLPAMYMSQTNYVKKNLETESNCILTDSDGCMITVSKSNQNMDNIFLVIKKTDKAIDYAGQMYHKQKIRYFVDILLFGLKVIWITIWITIIVAIILLILYYKGFVYIVYWGKKK